MIERLDIKSTSYMPDDNKARKQRCWERLLKITSQLIADMEEVSPLKANYRSGLKQELQLCVESLDALQSLSSFVVAGSSLHKPQDEEGYVILVFDAEEKGILYQEFFRHQKQAVSTYDRVEKSFTEARYYSLMISTSQMSKLESAYPNYAGNCQKFIDLLKSFLR